MARAAIALGSNLGDRLEHLRAGADGVEELGVLVAVSPLYETAPVGGPEQGRFLNAVVVVETDAPPSDVLAHLLDVETRRGRIRDVQWGPRTLDLDLIVHDGGPVDQPSLTVPHPRAHERGFVLAPLADVWPDARLADGSTSREALTAVGTEGLRPWHGAWRVEMPRLGAEATRWVAAQVVVFAVWLAVALLTAAPLSTVRSIVGGALVAVAVALLEGSRRALGRNLTPYPQPRAGTRLVDSGPYAHVRHPIYAGVLVALAGASIVTGSWPAGIATVVASLFFVAKSGVEERALSIGVPGYVEYLDRVRWRLVPGVM